MYGGIFGPRGDTILAHGYQGAFHIWKKRTMSTSEDSERIELWQPLVAPSGHFGPVQVCQITFLMMIVFTFYNRIYAGSPRKDLICYQLVVINQHVSMLRG